MFYTNYSELAIAHDKISDFRSQATRDRQVEEARGQNRSWFSRRSTDRTKQTGNLRHDEPVKVS